MPDEVTPDIFDMAGAQQKVQDVNDQWAAYDAAQQRYSGRQAWDLGWKAPTAPSQQRYTGSLDDQAALQDWAKQSDAQTATDQKWADSMLNPSRYTSQTGSTDAYARAAQNDIENYRRVVEENKVNAQAFGQEVKDLSNTSKQALESTYGVDGSKRLGEIDTSMQQAEGDIVSARAAADQSYQETLRRLDDVNKVAQDSVAWADTQRHSVLSKLHDDVSKQMEEVRSGIRKDTAIKAQQIAADLQAAGYSIDSPQAKAEARKLGLQTMQETGTLAVKAQGAYNTLRTDTANKQIEIGANLRSNLAATMASGAATAQEAGDARTAAYVDTAKLRSSIKEWGESAKNEASYQYQLARAATDMIAIQGGEAAASLFASSNQWVGDAPFVSEMINLTQGFKDKNEEDIANLINLGMSGLGMYLNYDASIAQAHATEKAGEKAMWGNIIGGIF